MARKGGSTIETSEAVDIANKLKAERRKKGKHTELVIVRHNGKLIGTYQIRHSRNISHHFIPTQIHISETQALALARCTMSADEYFDEIRRKGMIS